MTQTELFDKLLKHLDDNPNDYWNIDSLAKQQFDETNDKIIESIVDELLERHWTTSKKDYKWSQIIHQNGRQIIEKFGSYSSFLQSLDKAQNKTDKEKKIKRILSLIGTAGVLWGATFTYLNYYKDETIKQKDQEIHQQQTTIDSIKYQLGRQRSVSDSLQTILVTWSDTTNTKYQ